MSQKTARKLVDQVNSRLHLLWLGARTYQFLLYAAAVYAAFLVVVKLIGLAPDWVTPGVVGWSILGAVPVLAILLGLIFHRRPTAADAAHAIDQRMQTKDLFLTDTMLAGAPGEFAPLVTEDAARQAPGIRAGTVVPYEWSNKTANAFAVLALLALAMTFIPQFDLFGINADRETKDKRQDQLHKMADKTVREKKLIKKAATRTALERSQTDLTLKKLEQTFREMKAQDQQGNTKKLQNQQKKVGKMADQKRKELDKQLKQGGSNPGTVKKFGSLVDPKTRQFEDQLNKGEVSDVQKHIGEMKKLAEDIAKSKDPQEKQKLKQQLKKKMEQLQQSLENGTSTQQLNQSVQNAMDQMNMAGMDGMSEQQMQQSMQGMQQSLDLAQDQLQDMADQMQDMQQMDSTLQAIQNAMNANQQQSLDGSNCEGCEGQGMAQYAEMYNELMENGEGGGGQGQGGGEPLLTRQPGAGQQPGQGGQPGQNPGQGNGPGMGGPGQGQGNFAEYNDGAKTNFKDELSKSKYQAGKVLMSWKTRELSEKGSADMKYEDALKVVRQAADAALQADDIPPGYHGPIGDYYGQGLEKDLQPAEETK